MEDRTLDQIRTKRGLTQSRVSAVLGMTQAAVSKLEFRSDSYISSVRRFIEALDGRLELHAVFPDESVRIRGLDGDDVLTALRSLIHKECRLEPLVPATGRFRNAFHVRGIDDDERQVELEKDNGDHVHIPIRRIIEVLPGVPGARKAPTLTLKGRVQWFPDIQRWRFVE